MASLRTAIILLSVLLSGLLEVNGDGGAVEPEQREFDYFLLALQWPATFCSTHKSECCPQNGCCQGENNPPPGFTIHGLWANNNDGSFPSCCSDTAFDETQISTLVGALNKYWPILSCNNISSCHNQQNPFWAHEWEKHGTCSSSVTGDEYEYFLTTLNLYFKYNVTEVLFEAGYVPTNSEKYPSNDIISVIENAFHTTPQLSCKNGVLKEVRLCFTKDFKVRECVGGSNCPDYVSLPEFEFFDGTKTESWSIAGVESS